MRVDLGARIFPTKKALTEAIREVLYRYPIGTIITDPLDHFFIFAVLDRHHQAERKIGCGVRSFRVDAMAYGTRGFAIIRDDGSETDFSFMVCVTPTNKWSDIQQAYRITVEAQVLSFRDSAFSMASAVVCPLTGRSITKDESDVDHIAPNTFLFLLKKFANVIGVKPEDLPIGDSEDGLIGRRISNPSVEQAWLEFHKANAKLRMISKEAHRKLRRS